MTRLKDALATLGGTSERLSRVSVRTYQNPYTAVDWPAALDPAAEWFSSPELLSLYGTGYWDELGSRPGGGSASWRRRTSTASTFTARRA